MSLIMHQQMKERATAWLYFTLLCLVLQAIIPRGYMPAVAEDGGLAFSFCAVHDPDTAAMLSAQLEGLLESDLSQGSSHSPQDALPLAESSLCLFSGLGQAPELPGYAAIFPRIDHLPPGLATYELAQEVVAPDFYIPISRAPPFPTV